MNEYRAALRFVIIKQCCYFCLIVHYMLLARNTFLLLLLLPLQSSVDLSPFQNCPPLFSVLLLTSPVPHAHFFRSSSTASSHLNIVFPTCQVPSGLRTVSFLQGSSSSQPPHSSYLYHLNNVQFVVECINFIIVYCSPYVIIVNRTVNPS